MLADFRKAFDPTPEEIEQFKTKVLEFRKEAIANKKCTNCQNTYWEYWNNHGHDDHTTHCKFSGKCIDFDYGTKCPNWCPQDIDEGEWE